MFVIILILFVICNFSIGNVFTFETLSSNEKCNPYIDIVFVLDQTLNISKADYDLQMTFVQHILKDHVAPKGAVRVSLMSCGDTITRSSSFTDKQNISNEEQSQKSIEYVKDGTRHCLDNVNLKFKSESRDDVAKMVVIIKGLWDWDVETAGRHVSASKDNLVTIVVIAIGIKEFKGLSALRRLATSDSTYFVLSKFEDLNALAKVLTKGSCKLISLDLRSEITGHTEQSTTERPQHREFCIRITDKMFKRYIPGFGYTRLKCKESEVFDFNGCSCV
ncbi:uncharacterized protein LOC128237309 [Mya arenaria]|uniref:uncharacterized protein LOC128237309 n=1 Tax=Mya arenaria TaxID=6604 RepID=UPI0022E82E40|nr:uncharacterized protein LOC128237309 [Mya arenaria]